MTIKLSGFCFVLGMVVSSVCIAGDVSQCSGDAITIQIVDEKGSGPVSVLSDAGVFDSNPSVAPPFRDFVSAVTKHLAGRLGKEKLCFGGFDNKKYSLIKFVNWPLVIGDGEKPSESTLSFGEKTSGGCRISSPWIDLAFERKPTPWIRGVVRWNERQLLVDQAILSGMRNVQTNLVMPLGQSEFIRLAESEYAKSEILHEPADGAIETRVPMDLLWLFRRAWQSTLSPFFGEAMSSMDKAMNKGGEGYAQIVIALIDRCLAADGVESHYDNVLEISDLISLDNYKIDTPIR